MSSPSHNKYWTVASQSQATYYGTSHLGVGFSLYVQKLFRLLFAGVELSSYDQVASKQLENALQANRLAEFGGSGGARDVLGIIEVKVVPATLQHIFAHVVHYHLAWCATLEQVY